MSWAEALAAVAIMVFCTPLGWIGLGMLALVIVVAKS
jgi:hypothetical protein